MQTIYLDISSKGVIPTIYAKQHDVGRKFRAVLTDGGVPYNEAENYDFSVWYEGTSGEGNYTHIGDESAFSVNGNVVEVELIEQMLSNYGNTIACLVMSSANGDQIATWNIDVSVEAVPGFGSEAATEYFTAFSQTAAQVKADADRAESAASLFSIDDSLTKKGSAADAKAVGDRFYDVDEELSRLENDKQPVGNYLVGTDTGLNSSGVAADSFAVGERFKEMPKIYPPSPTEPTDWKNGDIWLKPVED